MIAMAIFMAAWFLLLNQEGGGSKENHGSKEQAAHQILNRKDVAGRNQQEHTNRYPNRKEQGKRKHLNNRPDEFNHMILGDKLNPPIGCLGGVEVKARVVPC